MIISHVYNCITTSLISEPIFKDSNALSFKISNSVCELVLPLCHLWSMILLFFFNSLFVCLEARPIDAQDLLLNLYSGITPGVGLKDQMWC